MIRGQREAQQLIIVVDRRVLGLLWRGRVERSDHLGEVIIVAGRKAVQRVWQVVRGESDVVAIVEGRAHQLKVWG